MASQRQQTRFQSLKAAVVRSGVAVVVVHALVLVQAAHVPVLVEADKIRSHNKRIA